MNSGVQAYIDLPIYRGLGFGLNCQALVPASERERGRLKAKTERQTATDKQAKKQISTVEMSPLGDVAVATCSPRHNARRVILKEVSLRPLWDREGFLILMLGSQGHSERRVILMMILMGSNGGREVSAQTNPSLIKITLQAKTFTHRHPHAQMHTTEDGNKKKFWVWAYYTHSELFKFVEKHKRVYHLNYFCFRTDGNMLVCVPVLWVYIQSYYVI